MAVVLEDAIIKVKIDTGAARDELKKIDQEQKNLKRETETSKKETKKQAEEAQGTVRKAVEAVTGRVFPHSISSLTEIPQLAAGFIPVVGPGIQSALRIEEAVSEKYGPLGKGLIEGMIGSNTKEEKEKQDKTIDKIEKELGMTLPELRIYLQSLDRTIEDAVDFGTAAAVLDFDVDAEWAKRFWDGTQKYNYMQAQLQRYGRQAGMEAAGRFFGKLINKNF